MSNYKDNARICEKCAHMAKCAAREEFLEKCGILDDLNHIIGSNTKIHCGDFKQKETPAAGTADAASGKSADGKTNYAVSIHQNSGKVKR